MNGERAPLSTAADGLHKMRQDPTSQCGDHW